MQLTKKQQISLLHKWQQNDQGMTFLGFRRSAHSTIGCDDAIVIQWCNMWLCIETDGYTHS